MPFKSTENSNKKTFVVGPLTALFHHWSQHFGSLCKGQKIFATI
jgi:hypothetical protein